MRGATIFGSARSRYSYFNPRSSCEERPRHATLLRDHRRISIHAPHARSDSVTTSCRLYSLFQSTLLMRGATCLEVRDGALVQAFQSTLLMRGATMPDAPAYGVELISIHAPHARSDGTENPDPRRQLISIHAPHARSDETIRDWFAKLDSISIHAPHARSDEVMLYHVHDIFIFQSTLLMRGATVSLSSIDLLDFIIDFSRTPHLFPKTLLLTLCPVSSISCVMALRA